MTTRHILLLAGGLLAATFSSDSGSKTLSAQAALQPPKRHERSS